MALILNIETSTRVCSVALGRNGKCIGVKEEHSERYSHAEKLTTYIDELLKSCDVAYKDLDAVAVSQGPGSYTGLRIGVSSAKGLSYALEIPLIAIETLKSLANLVAEGNSGSSQTIIPLLDARRMEVFAAVYNENLNEIRGVQADIIDENSYSDFLNKQTVTFLGDGAAKCTELLGSHPNSTFLADQQISAKGMISLSEVAFNSEKFEDSAYFEPFYLKEFVAGKPKKML